MISSIDDEELQNQLSPDTLYFLNIDNNQFKFKANKENQEKKNESLTDNKEKKTMQGS